MFRISKQLVRVALVLMLFQFLSPAFIPLSLQQAPAQKNTSYSVQHNLIVIPTFLKEKDEKESSEFSPVCESTPILDLSSHSLNLLATHEGKFSALPDQHSFPPSPLITLHCSFLI